MNRAEQQARIRREIAELKTRIHRINEEVFALSRQVDEFEAAFSAAPTREEAAR